VTPFDRPFGARAGSADPEPGAGALTATRAPASARAAAGGAVIPFSATAIDRASARCRRLVTKRALLAAGVAMVPVPGVDWLTDVGILIKLLPDINREFGLSPEQVERLAPDRRVVVYKALSTAGGLLVGRVITREIVLKALSLVGVRLTTQQAAKFVPIAGQAVSAVLTFSALKYVCELHIRQCEAVCRTLADIPPASMVERVDTTPAD
jgi:uncharacterized protein (DUF697 family)